MRSTSRLVILLGVLVVIFVALLVCYLFNHSTNSPTSTNSTSPFSNSIAPSNSAQQPVPVAEKGQYYSVNASYPQSTPLAQSASNSVDASAVQIMQTWVQNATQSFIQENDLANPSQQDIQSEGLNQEKYSLSTTYQLYKGPGSFSYIFSINQDTGGAHPNMYFQAFTFDNKTGQQLQLSDLFVPNSDYLNILSSITQVDLEQQLGQNADPTLINPGTAPIESNFQNFATDGEYLDIFFAPYQVAPYAYGSQVVRIPLTSLASILKTQYQ